MIILTTFIANFYNGALSLGIEPAQDPSNGKAQGIFRLQRSIDAKTHTRSSARVNRYDRDTVRPNYHVLTNTAVSRVRIKAKAAAGFDLVSVIDSTERAVYARKEAIVAAGAIHTPQILQLSGIGDAKYLRKLGIKSVVDLPGVGRNLQDHLVLKVNYNCAYKSHLMSQWN